MQGLTAAQIHGFASVFLLKNFDNPQPTPNFHHELWELMCSHHNKVAVAAPRGHAKTTAVTHCFILACLCFRIKQHVLIVSDTEGQAAAFLKNIKMELEENEELIRHFKIDKFIKDSETEIIVRFEDGHLFRVWVKGSGQRVRGLLWRHKRPDLIVGDDLENDELVLNKDRRDKFSKWFLGALMPCGGDLCDIRVVGTIMHMDSLLESFMPPYTHPNIQHDGLKYWVDELVGGWMSVRYQAHNPDFSYILWPEKWPKKRLEAERQVYISRGNPEGYSQEYLNYPIDKESAYFREEDLLEIPENELNSRGEYFAAADLAISTKDSRAYTVIIIGKLIEDRFLDVVDVIRFRGDALRIIDEIFYVQDLYNPVIFGIEQENIAKSIGPFLYEQMGRNGKPFINIEKLPPIEDKQKRARPIQARVRTQKVRFDKTKSWWHGLLEELTTFPRGKFSDQVDALAWLGFIANKIIDVPTDEELREDQYYDEFEKHVDFYTQYGANRVTGY